ncbi:MAG: ARMT1-like domain-containing protein [Bacillota bacterium]
MRAVEECYDCLERLIITTATLATDEPRLQEQAVETGQNVLKKEFSFERIPAMIAAAAQRAIRDLCGNADPFREVKDRELALSAQLVNEAMRFSGEGWDGLFRLAALGNTVDFFRDLETVAEEMGRPVDFVVNEIPVFLGRLESARRILFMTDNAAECYFDLPLYRCLSEAVEEVIYVVKARPVQNDLTLTDLKACGLKEAFKRVETTGTDSPGLDMEAASPEFKTLYSGADLILAKGMGYYETFSEVKDDRVMHLLKAKCRPVAAAIGVPQGSFVAAFSSK